MIPFFNHGAALGELGGGNVRAEMRVEVHQIEGQAGKRQAKIDHNFYAFVARFWLQFASQLGPQSHPKSIKNRCSDRFLF